MKKQKLLALTLLLIIGLAGCGQNNTVDNKDSLYDKDVAEMSLSIDINRYKDAFDIYLNEGVYECKVDNLDNELLSASLINEVSVVPDTNTEIDIPTDVEIEDEQTDLEEYPIIDTDGNIIDYGTKEESEESFRVFNEQPYYRIESVEVYMNKILFKVHDKGENQTFIFDVSLNDNMQMDSYTKLKIGG